MSLGGSLRRLYATLRRRRLDDDLDEEIRFHIAMETEENLRRGLPPDEARRAAERAFGGVTRTREEHRDARGLPWVEDAARDAHLALRSIRRAPLLAAALILLVALGIGANTAVYTVVDGVLLRPLPYPRPDELYQLQRVGAREAGPGQTGATVEALRKLADDDRRIAAVGWSVGMNLDDGPSALYVRAQPASYEYFDVMGVPPSAGRAFQAGDEHPGAAPVAIVGHDLAQRLGGTANVLGRSIVLSGKPHQVVGVLPPGFRTYPRVDLLVPFRKGPEASGTNYVVLGRLRGGADDQLLAAAVSALREARQLGSTTTLRWTGLREGMSGFRRPTLLLLLGAVGLVLLIACANVAGLLLVKAQSRGAELAVRAALGGGRGRLLRQLLTESLVYAVLGGLLGVAVAHAAVELLVGLAPPDVAEWRVVVNGRVLLFALALTVVTGIAFGLAPALRASRIDVRSAVAGGLAGVASSSPRARWRRGLLVGEVALCTLLLLGAGLLGRTLLALRAVDLGFQPGSVLVLGMSPDLPAAALPAFFARARERTRDVPGTSGVVLAGGVPGRRGLNLPMRVPGADGIEAVGWRYISPGYFDLLGIPVRRGRDLDDRDGAAGPAVAIVNEAFARRYFPGDNSVGRTVQVHPFAPEAVDAPRTIVGVVGDTRDTTLVGAAEPTVYVPAAQMPPGLLAVSHRFFDACWLVRTDLPPNEVAARLGAIVRTVAPGLPFSEVTALEDVVAAHLVDERFLTWLLVIFAGVSLCIAITGIYGVTAYSVSQRSREIGIRMALGATPAAIVRGIVGEGVVVAVVGVGLGLVAVWPLGPVLARFLYGVAVFDPITTAAVVGVLLAAAGLACAAPAARAARVDPVANLRA